ncbi:MAG TPA: hypothetical protein VGD78_00685 [Chthoniobacterales bacterium]
MRDQLIQFLRRTPFVPFVLTLRGGGVYPIETVERMSVGNRYFTVVDQEGLILFLPFKAIEHVAIKDAPEVKA